MTGDICHEEQAKQYLHLCKTTRNKKLLGAPGRTTRSKDATRGSWHHYCKEAFLFLFFYFLVLFFVFFFRILLLLRFCFCCFCCFCSVSASAAFLLLLLFCFCFSASAAFVAFLLLLLFCFYCFSAFCVFLSFCSLLLLLFCFGSCSPFSFCFCFSICLLSNLWIWCAAGGALRPAQPPPRHEICTSSPTPAPATKSIKVNSPGHKLLNSNQSYIMPPVLVLFLFTVSLLT